MLKRPLITLMLKINNNLKFKFKIRILMIKKEKKMMKVTAINKSKIMFKMKVNWTCQRKTNAIYTNIKSKLVKLESFICPEFLHI